MSRKAPVFRCYNAASGECMQTMNFPLRHCHSDDSLRYVEPPLSISRQSGNSTMALPNIRTQNKKNPLHFIRHSLQGTNDVLNRRPKQRIICNASCNQRNNTRHILVSKIRQINFLPRFQKPTSSDRWRSPRIAVGRSPSEPELGRARRFLGRHSLRR